MKSFRTLAVAVVLLLPAPARAQSVVDQKPDSLRTLLRDHGYMGVPLQQNFMNGFYAVPTTVHSTPLTLHLDSGSGGNLALLRSIADSLGIRGTPIPPELGLAGATMTDTTRLAHFALGTTRFDSQFVRITTALAGFDGLIGAHLLSSLSAILDYSTDMLYIDSTSPRVTGLQSFLEARGAVAIPLTRVAKPNLHKVRYTMQAVVGSTTLTLLLDTGAQQEIVLDQQPADALGLQAMGRGRVNVIGGSAEMRMGRIGNLALGQMHLDTLSVMVLDLSSISQRDEREGFPRIDGVLGAGVLEAHRAIIDFGHDMLYLWR